MDGFALLGHEEEAGSQGGGRKSDDTSNEGVINVFFHGLSLRTGEGSKLMAQSYRR